MFAKYSRDPIYKILMKLTWLLVIIGGVFYHGGDLPLNEAIF